MRGYYRSAPNGTNAIVTSRRPTLVHFKEITDPKSLERIAYGKLNSAFGSGVKVLGVTIELTDKPITWGIDPIVEQFGGSSGMYRRDVFQRKEK